MKLLSAAALALAPLAAITAAPALADEAAAAKASALTINSPISALMANEAAKAVVVKHLGPLDQHPMYDQFKAMSLVDVQPWSQGAISDEALANIKADLARLG